MAKKVKLMLQRSGGHGHPAEVELEPERIATNHIILPGEYNPHSVRLWVVGNEYGALGAVWADNMEDAFDELVDQDLGAGLLVDEEDVDEEDRDDLDRLGNAGEAADLSYAWAGIVRLDPAHDCKLLCAFAEARGAGADNIDDFIR